jgi:V/A-type H+-transporting ATPase subunit C
LLQYLSTTSYGRFVSETTGAFPSRKIVERILYRSLVEDYSIIVRALRGHRERAVILALFSRFEGQNLKILMRAMFSGRTRREVEHLLYPLGRISRIPWEELWGTGSIEEVMGPLSRTVFGPALHYAFPQFSAQGRLFPLEMAIDQASFRQVSERVGVLPRSDRRAAVRVAGSFTDLLNVSWIIRLRVQFFRVGCYFCVVKTQS